MKKTETQRLPFFYFVDVAGAKTPLPYKYLHSFNLVALEATGADVTLLHLAVFCIGHLLHVGGKRPLCFTMGVADVVARRLTLSANSAYSRHISTSRGVFSDLHAKDIPLHTAFIIPFCGGKSN